MAAVELEEMVEVDLQQEALLLLLLQEQMEQQILVEEQAAVQIGLQVLDQIMHQVDLV